MRISKGKPPKPAKDAARAETPAQLARGGVEKRADVEQVMGDIVDDGSHASAAKLKKIVERVLGGDDDSDLQALIVKLTKATPTETVHVYELGVYELGVDDKKRES